jgi:hypothetical protein
MGRGAYTTKFKPAKAVVQVDLSAPIRISFLSRNQSETKLAVPVLNQPSLILESSRPQDETADSQTGKLGLPADSVIRTDLESDEGLSNSLPNKVEPSIRPTISQTSSSQSSGEDYKADLDQFEDLTIQETQSSASSLYSVDSSIYSRDSASIYSSTSSIYSSGTSIYSFDESEENENDRYARKGPEAGGLLHQQRTRPVPVRRQEPQDAASRERSSLAKKAAMFKNSRLPPDLPPFSTSLPSWSLICRAVRASQDCYASQTLTRRGTYTPADSSKDIKAMIIDDQLIDDSRLVIVSIRGTQCQSLSDWVVNKASNPVEPVGFLDDEENSCHAGFLQVAKAMVAQVTTQLQQHPASSERPSLLFTGHSAGGAVAAMLYSHMLSTTITSELTALASLFPSINCVTFGAPPVSLTPLPRRAHGRGVFLSFANEGDPVLRLSNAAYVKSLAKLMTASAPNPTGPVKVVRRSRGTSVIREVAPPPTPWAQLPLWPMPPPPMANAGEVILLRDKENGRAAASHVTSEDLRDVIFGDLSQHTVQAYIQRIKELGLAAMMGRM